MKIIHCADIHLSSPLTSLPEILREERRAELKSTFSRMVSYARENGISVILLSGDVFDDDKKPPKKDIAFFNSVVSNASDIDFLYLRGNHDMSDTVEPQPNIKFFSDSWTSYTYGNVTISGIELAAQNKDSYYSTLSLDVAKKNIVMLHGTVGSDINITKLRDKNIDYLALGHIHSYSTGEIDRRGSYAYSGCLEGRGFDETGEKGFIVLDTDGNGITHVFHPYSSKIIEEYRIDISGITDSYTVAQTVNNAVNLQKNGIYRIILTGETESVLGELETEVRTYLAHLCANLSVKDETSVRINYDDYKNDLSLKGEFVRTVQASNRTEEEKARIITYGLKALLGESPE